MASSTSSALIKTTMDDVRVALQDVDTLQLSGDLDGAHQMLVQLIRRHSQVPEVSFRLGWLRQRLGYHVSAEALFTRAFEHGFLIPEEHLSTYAGENPHVSHVWVTPEGGFQLLLRNRSRPRRIDFIGIETT